MSTNIEKEEYIIQYGYEFKWFRNDGTGQQIIEEQLKIKKSSDKRFSLYINSLDASQLYNKNLFVMSGNDIERINRNQRIERRKIRAQSKAEGKIEGIKEALIKTIKNMLKYNVKDEDIMKYTNTTPEELEAIKKMQI